MSSRWSAQRLQETSICERMHLAARYARVGILDHNSFQQNILTLVGKVSLQGQAKETGGYIDDEISRSNR